jgi:hypothetical protein
VLDRVPRIKLEREPEGRIVWLEPDEEARLLEACRASRTKHLASLVRWLWRADYGGPSCWD